ncbi:MAG: hypothetical protein FWD85_05725 [Microbacteriaceae bacterium]|nr:hypothetical protein [Microbacteriaceae bacterium]MCL2794789.1 hypothetical protein [Microbacteriaceae bacterium]
MTAKSMPLWIVRAADVTTGPSSWAMRPRSPLPAQFLGRPFVVDEARAAGLSPGRLRGADLSVPHRGVRAPSGSRSHRQRAEAYAELMDDSMLFSHVTAAHLLGAPLPQRLLGGPIHVSVLAPQRAPRVRGVIGHQLAPREYRGLSNGRLRVLDLADVWVQLAGILTLDEVIVGGDYLITGSEPWDGRAPLTSWAELAAAVERAGSARGVRVARAALEEVRYGCLSPQETRLRLLIERAGLPAPVLNHRIFDESGRTVAMLDGAYPERRLAYEYMGDHHRADRRTYRNDMVRRARVEDLGWTQLDISADDLDLRPLETLARIARRLSATEPRAHARANPIDLAVVASKRPR